MKEPYDCSELAAIAGFVAHCVVVMFVARWISDLAAVSLILALPITITFALHLDHRRVTRLERVIIEQKSLDRAVTTAREMVREMEDVWMTEDARAQRRRLR